MSGSKLKHHIWAPQWRGSNLPLLSDCREAVSSGARSMSFHQCSRRALVFEEVEGYPNKLGFCKQHSLVEQQARANARDAKYAERMTGMTHRWQRNALERACFDAVVRMTPDTAAHASISGLHASVLAHLKNTSKKEGPE